MAAAPMRCFQKWRCPSLLLLRRLCSFMNSMFSNTSHETRFALRDGQQVMLGISPADLWSVAASPTGTIVSGLAGIADLSARVKGLTGRRWSLRPTRSFGSDLIRHELQVGAVSLGHGPDVRMRQRIPPPCGIVEVPAFAPEEAPSDIAEGNDQTDFHGDQSGHCGSPWESTLRWTGFR
jgi:hypothetical protein